MTGDLGVDRTIRRAIDRGDYLRRATSRLSDLNGQKEWMHFCIADSDVDLIVNFSTVEDLRPSACPGDEVHRLTCAVRLDGWEGDVEHFDAADVRARAGRVAMRFGESTVRYAGGAYHLQIALRRRPVEMDLSFHPAAIPSQVNNIVLGHGAPLHWFVVPRLLASGRITVAGRRIELENVPAYHDHNWGHFTWGQDFCWIWGYGQGVSRGQPWSFVFDRLSDRARNTDLRRGLVLWKGARQHRVWSGRELSIRTDGRFRPPTCLKLPRVMALVEPGPALDVPTALMCTGRSLEDHFELLFRSRNLCQFIAPNDGDLGVTTINEVGGELELSGSVNGEAFELRGHGMFEFLGG